MLKKIINIVTTSIVSLTMVFSSFMLTAQPVMAEEGGSTYSQGDKTSILTSCGDKAEDSKGAGIFCVLNIALTILTYGVGIAGTLGIVISGVMYLTARDNEQQMTKAKSRIINIVIGLAIYAVMWGFLQWILPGGALKGSS